MRLALVTTCRDPGDLLRETVDSVLAQRVGPASDVLVDYAIVDAASNDGTLAYLRSLEPPPWLRLTIVSEPDRGLYDGLRKGFELVRGDWYGWLNAGDLLGPGCHPVLATVLAEAPDVSWVTGLQILHDRDGLIDSASTPLRFRGDLLRRGLYGRTALPFLQQESTFWRDALQARVPPAFGDLRLAGDLWLWARFARELADERFPLAVVSAHLGGFRAHDGHLSRTGGGKDAYLAEAADAVGPVRPVDRLRAHCEARRWAGVNRFRKRHRQRTLYVEGTRLTVLTGKGRRRRWAAALRRGAGAIRLVGADR